MLYPNAGVQSKPSSPREAWLRSLPVTLFALLVLVVYADPVLTRRNFVGRDLVPYGLPMEKAIHDAWARGRVPVWSTDVSGGRPLLPNPNTGTLYPVRPLLSFLPFPLAMRLFPVLHWISAGIGMYALLSALAASRSGAWIGAATFVFSGVSVSQVFYQPFGPAVALHPWLLWALVRPGGPRRKAVRLAVAWGLLFLLGDAFAVAIAALAASIWIWQGVAPGGRRRELVTLGLAIALAALAAAPQLVATALLIPQTQRAVIGFKLTETLAFTLAPWRLLELVVPYPFGDSWTLEESHVWGRGVFRCLYATIYSGAFALVGLVSILHGRGGAARFTRALFAAGVLLAAAGSFVPAAWGGFSSWIPLRYPEKFCVAIALALALSAGLAFDSFRNGSPRPRWLLFVGLALALAAAASRLFPAESGRIATAGVGAARVFSDEASRQLPGALAEAGLLWMATLVGLELLRRPRPARVVACVAILTAVPVVANRRIAPAENADSVFPPTAFARAIDRRDPEGTYRTIDESSYRAPTAMQRAAARASPYGTESARRSWNYHTQVLWGRGTVFNGDLDRGDLSRVESLRVLSVFAAAEPKAERFFSAPALRFGIRYQDQPPLPGYREFGGSGLQAWDENPQALPDIRLLERWQEAPGSLAALAALPKLSAGELVLETGRSARGTARPGQVRVIERSPERLRLETSSPDPSWLFVLRGFWNYRNVEVDGVSVDAVPAELGFSAVSVPAGKHRIDWREQVPGGEVSRWGPAVFALSAALLVASRGIRGSVA